MRAKFVHEFFTIRSRLRNALTRCIQRRCALVEASTDNANTLYSGELEIRLCEGLVLATGRALTLSVREFELLAAMARRAGAALTRAELYSAAWGGDLREGDRSVDVYVSKLRGKLEAARPTGASSTPTQASVTAFSRSPRSFHEMFTPKHPQI